MRRSAAAKASAAADALLAWLDTQPSSSARARSTDGAGPAALDGAPPFPIPHDEAPGPMAGAAGAAEPAPSQHDKLAREGRSGNAPSAAFGSAGSAASSVSSAASEGSTAPPVAPMTLAHTDWLHHRLTVTGPGERIKEFRRAAAGAGTVPWQLDLDRMQEDLFHLLIAPSVPQQGGLSVAGARIVARQLCDAVARRQALAAARIGRSRACPFDLHALIPVPERILSLGPDDPAALAWLWQHWGTTRELRHVAEEDAAGQDGRRAPVAGHEKIRISFWSADWSPWPALAQLEATWPALRFVLRPRYDLA